MEKALLINLKPKKMKAIKTVVIAVFVLTSTIGFSQLKTFKNYKKISDEVIPDYDEKVTFKMGDTVAYELNVINSEKDFENIYNEVNRILKELNTSIDDVEHAFDDSLVKANLHSPSDLYTNCFVQFDDFFLRWTIEDPKKPKKKIIRLYLGQTEDELWMFCIRFNLSDVEDE